MPSIGSVVVVEDADVVVGGGVGLMMAFMVFSSGLAFVDARLCTPNTYPWAAGIARYAPLDAASRC